MKSHVLGFWLAGSNLLSLLSSNPTIAQIAADETLIRNTVVRQQRNVTVIEAGTSAGANLFHSFGSFSVPTATNPQLNGTVQINSHREALCNNQTATVDWVSIGNKAEQSRKVRSNNQQLIIKDFKSKISNSVIEANV